MNLLARMRASRQNTKAFRLLPAGVAQIPSRSLDLRLSGCSVGLLISDYLDLGCVF